MAAPFSPEQIESLDFPTVLRGYSIPDVQEVLGAIADTVRYYEDEAERAYERVGRELGDLLQQAKDYADSMERDAKERADEALMLAEREASEKIRRAEQRVSELESTEKEVRGHLQALRERLSSATDRGTDSYDNLPVDAFVEQDADAEGTEGSGTVAATG